MDKTGNRPPEKVVASIVPVRKIPPKPKRHRWDDRVSIMATCLDCGMRREDRSSGWTHYAYYSPDGKFLGSAAPPCEPK